MEYKKIDFVFEEDYIVMAECENCGEIIEEEEELEEGVCPECGAELINTTSHEGCECAICKGYIDMWENVYRSKKKSDILICEDCFNSLEEL